MDNAPFVPLRVHYGGGGGGDGEISSPRQWDSICMLVDGAVTELPQRKSAPRESSVAAIHRRRSAPGVIRIGDTETSETKP